MNQKLEYNMKALIAYSQTDRYQQIWEQSQSVDYLAQRSQIFLEIFNTFQNKLENQTEKDIKELIVLLTKREFFIALVNNGISAAMESIAGILKLKDDDITRDSVLPKFNITDKEYKLFYDTAEYSYMHSDQFHERRHILGDKYAEHGFDVHWSILGDVFNKIIAPAYVEELKNRSVEKIPYIYQQTLSGKEFVRSKKTAVTKQY